MYSSMFDLYRVVLLPKKNDPQSSFIIIVVCDVIENRLGLVLCEIFTSINVHSIIHQSRSCV